MFRCGGARVVEQRNAVARRLAIRVRVKRLLESGDPHRLAQLEGFLDALSPAASTRPHRPHLVLVRDAEAGPG